MVNELLLIHFSQISFLRIELTKQSVGIFITTSLPRGISIGKKEWYAQFCIHLVGASKLFTSVGGSGLKDTYRQRSVSCVISASIEAAVLSGIIALCKDGSYALQMWPDIPCLHHGYAAALGYSRRAGFRYRSSCRWF